MLPRLAILRFVVYDDTNRFVAHRILPVEQLKPGYRFICLRSESNQPIPSASLLVHIKVHDFLADKHRALADALTNPMAYLSQLEAREKQLDMLEDEETNDQQHQGSTNNQFLHQASVSSNSPPPTTTKAALLSTHSIPMITTSSPGTTSLSSVKASEMKTLSTSASRGCRLSSTGIERLQKSLADRLPPITEIYTSSSCQKLVRKRDNILYALRKKCAKVDFGGEMDDSAKNEKILTMWRKCYAEQRGVAVKYTELLAASAMQTLNQLYSDHSKLLSQLFRSEERELRRVLARERSARLREVSNATALGDPNSLENKEDIEKKKRNLQQELIDRAVDEISTIQEANSAMEQKLKQCFEDRREAIADWRLRMENELEQQFANVLSNLENAAATGTLARLHAAERMNHLKSGSLISGPSNRQSKQRIGQQLTVDNELSSDTASSCSMHKSRSCKCHYVSMYFHLHTVLLFVVGASGGGLFVPPVVDEKILANTLSSPEEEEASQQSVGLVDGEKSKLPVSCSMLTPISQPSFPSFDDTNDDNNVDTVNQRRSTHSRSLRAFRRLFSCFR